MKILTTFHPFPLLPLEIQSLVWEYAFFLHCSETNYGIYIEHRPAYPALSYLPYHEPEPGFYANFPLTHSGRGRQRPVLGGMGVINGLDVPHGSIRLQGGWTEVGDPEGESKQERERVLIYADTELPALLHATRESRRRTLIVLKKWLEGLLESMCRTVDEEGKERVVQQKEWLRKANGEVLANVVKHLLGSDNGTKRWWKDEWEALT